MRRIAFPEPVKIPKFENFYGFVQLIHCPMQAKNSKKPKHCIDKLGNFYMLWAFREQSVKKRPIGRLITQPQQDNGEAPLAINGNERREREKINSLKRSNEERLGKAIPENRPQKVLT